MQAERFAQAALDAVANDGSADGAGHGESQPRTGRGRRFGTRPAKGGKQRAGDAEALVIDEPEFGGPQDPGSPGKRPLVMFRIS
jgi:hypothetical protein